MWRSAAWGYRSRCVVASFKVIFECILLIHSFRDAQLSILPFSHILALSLRESGPPVTRALLAITLVRLTAHESTIHHRLASCLCALAGVRFLHPSLRSGSLSPLLYIACVSPLPCISHISPIAFISVHLVRPTLALAHAMHAPPASPPRNLHRPSLTRLLGLSASRHFVSHLLSFSLSLASRL